MSKTLLKIAAGINLVAGGLMTLLGLLLVKTIILLGLGIIIGAAGAINLTIGALFLNVAQKDGAEFLKRKNTVLVLSIISILTGHIITFILGIIAFTDIIPTS